MGNEYCNFKIIYSKIIIFAIYVINSLSFQGKQLIKIKIPTYLATRDGNENGF